MKPYPSETLSFSRRYRHLRRHWIYSTRCLPLGRAGRIAAAGAGVLAANFGFNDAHRKVIDQVEQAYYRLLNTMGQEQASRASLANAQTVQQAAEERLKQGLATLPDVLGVAERSRTSAI